MRCPSPPLPPVTSATTPFRSIASLLYCECTVASPLLSPLLIPCRAGYVVCYSTTHASSRQATNRLPGQQPDYSITSSASARKFEGALTPSCLAVLRLTANQNLPACSIGRSPGFVPWMILAA